MQPFDIKLHLALSGWKKQKNDTWTKTLALKVHGQKSEQRLCRVKFNKESITLQMKSNYSSAWFRIGGAPFLSVKTRLWDGAMVVGSYVFPKPEIAAAQGL